MSTLLEELQGTEAMPDISISLPSEGMWYQSTVPKGSKKAAQILTPNADVNELDIKVISVLAELNYKDPYLMVSGKSLPKLIRHVCPAVTEPDLLVEVDIEAILLGARIASYGTEMKLEHQCSQKVGKSKTQCSEPNTINLDLQHFIMRYAPFSTTFDEEYMSKFSLLLEKLGQTVILRLPTYRDVIGFQKLSIINEDKLKNLNEITTEAFLLEEDNAERYARIMESSTESAVDSIASCIHYVIGRDGEKHMDRQEIDDYVRGIPSEEIGFIKDRINEITKPLAELNKLEYTCIKCKKTNTLSLHMDPQRLFTRGADSLPPKKPLPKSPGTVRKGKTPSKVMRR